MSIVPRSCGSGESGVAKISSIGSVDRGRNLFDEVEVTISDILGGGGGTEGHLPPGKKNWHGGVKCLHLLLAGV